jgi:hypothetical protein
VLLDIFNNNAFGVIALTDAVNKLRFVPGLLGKMGLFTETSISVTTATIEDRQGVLALVPPTPRGGPGLAIDKFKRHLFAIPVPHFEVNDSVMAEEVQNLRPFGQSTGLMSVQTMLSQRLQQHSQSMEATLEYSRVGAVKGVITYADGSTLDLFATFGVTQLPPILFDLSNATPVPGAVRQKCATSIRNIAVQLDGVPFSGVYAICGDTFFDNLIMNTEVRASFLNQIQAAELRTGYVHGGMSYGRFEFGGIVWENYRGSVGGQLFVDTDKCHIMPLVPGLFRTVYSPADYIETVNTLGQRMYAKQFVMPNGKGIHLDTQTNGLCYCTRPNVLQVGHMGAT